jgi:hypothetical protein
LVMASAVSARALSVLIGMVPELAGEPRTLSP